MKNKRKFTVTIELEEEQSIQVCDTLHKMGQLNMLVSLLVDLEIPRYSDGSALSTNVTPTQPSIPNDLLNLLYDIKEATEEIKDKIGELPEDKTKDLNIKDHVMQALVSYGSVKKDDIAVAQISTVAVAGSQVATPISNSGDLISGDSTQVEPKAKTKEAKPSSVGNKGFKNKLAKMKSLKG